MEGIQLSCVAILSTLIWGLAIWRFPTVMACVGVSFAVLCVALLIRGETEREYWYGVGLK